MQSNIHFRPMMTSLGSRHMRVRHYLLCLTLLIADKEFFKKYGYQIF